MVSLMKLLVVAALVAQNEASTTSMGMRFASKAEIMASMTTKSAVKSVLRINGTRQSPELMALIQTKFGHELRKSSASADDEQDDDDEDDADVEGNDQDGIEQRTLLSTRNLLQLQNSLRGATTPTGYAAVSRATQMLNEMGVQARTSLEAEQLRCTEENATQIRNMEVMRTSVSNFNSDAASARGHVVKAEGEIQTLNVNVRNTEEQLEKVKQECTDEINSMQYQLRIILADITVMGNILEMVDCSVTPAPQAFMLVQCDHCDGPLLQHEPVQELMGSLQSEVARDTLRDSMSEAYDESLDGQEPLSLTQVMIENMRSIHRHRFGQVHRHEVLPADSPVDAVNTSDVPVAPELADCVPTTKCSLSSSPNCEKLKDRFLVVQTGIVDKRDELDEAVRNKEKSCLQMKVGFADQLDSLQAKLSQERTSLATATADQNQAEASSHVQAEQHEQASAQYASDMKTCCDNQNNARSEMCALEKIRGELNNLNGTKVFIQDCEVSEWREETCSATCGGGRIKSSRSIIVHEVGGGMACPLLESEKSCNSDPCPVDCQVGEWGGWSQCSAECGGGVRERTRDIIVPAQHGGEPCPATDDETSCHMGACDANCELSDWSKWSQCSKACGGGVLRRQKSIDTPAKGTGKCWGPETWKRLRFRRCNSYSCNYLLRRITRGSAPRDFLRCSSAVDVTLLIDGSGSLGSYGWSKSKELAADLVRNLNDGSSNVQVAVELFSGPKNWDDYRKCTDTPNEVNMETTCGMKWVSRYTSDTAGVATQISNLAWPQLSTLTSLALGQAQANLKNGRAEANSIVIVLTDGKPLSQWNTKMAAQRLQLKSKVLWVPIGRGAPRRLIKELASTPQTDHVISVSSFYSLRSNWRYKNLVNTILSTTCPSVS